MRLVHGEAAVPGGFALVEVGEAPQCCAVLRMFCGQSAAVLLLRMFCGQSAAVLLLRMFCGQSAEVGSGLWLSCMVLNACSGAAQHSNGSCAACAAAVQGFSG